jgi:recombination protein RecR
MDPIKQLTTFFAEFPGIGPRQARRFVYFLLRQNPSFLDNISETILQLKETVQVCNSCFQYFQKKNGQQMCKICADDHRDASTLLIVSDDRDLEHLEKSALYTGLYFVLGGIVPILAANPDERIRSIELQRIVKQRIANTNAPLKEIILALNATPDGENTAHYLEALLTPMVQSAGVKITHLGKGISTGTEIEYSDTETLKNALANRRVN